MLHLQKRHKLLILLGLLVFLTACSVPYVNGKVDPNYIISLETPFEVVAKDSGVIFALIIWPFAILTNFIGKYFDAGFSVILSTFIFHLVLLPFLLRGQEMQEKMSMLNPEVKKIEAKYANNNSPEAQNAKAMELTSLYKKNNISLFTPFLFMFVQLFGIITFQSVVQRAAVVAHDGTFLGFLVNVHMGPKLFEFSWFYICLFATNLVSSYLVTKLSMPAQNEGSPMGSSGMIIFSLVMISFLTLNQPTVLNLFFITSSIFKIVLIYFTKMKKQELVKK